jgi:hypothetical protein
MALQIVETSLAGLRYSPSGARAPVSVEGSNERVSGFFDVPTVSIGLCSFVDKTNRMD